MLSYNNIQIVIITSDMQHQSGGKMKRKKAFQELDLCDNFLFAAVMQDEEICKGVLELLLGITIKKVVVEVEKIFTRGSEYRGIRMDVYAADEKQSIYNVEMQTGNRGNLPKRSRYYQAQIDTRHMKPGEDFNQLKKSFVIFICTFDPFGYGRYCYTIEERCIEDDIALGDETRKIFLNTRGKNADETDKDLIHFLKYVENSIIQQVQETDNAFLWRLHERIVEIKHDRKLEERYMLFEEMLAEEKAEGLREGLKKGEEKRQSMLCLISKMLEAGEADKISELSNQDFLAEMEKKYQIR